MKKNKAIGFRYVSEHESLFIRRVNGKYENEYYLNEEGLFVPRFFNKYQGLPKFNFEYEMLVVRDRSVTKEGNI